MTARALAMETATAPESPPPPASRSNEVLRKCASRSSRSELRSPSCSQLDRERKRNSPRGRRLNVRRGVHVDRLRDPVVAAQPAGADPVQEPRHPAVLRLQARDDDGRELQLERPLPRRAETQPTAHPAGPRWSNSFREATS